MTKAAELFRYNRLVFIAPHWPEIFRQDTERRQDLAEAARTHAAMLETYRDCGYKPVSLPRAPVAERVRFVLARVRTAGFG